MFCTHVLCISVVMLCCAIPYFMIYYGVMFCHAIPCLCYEYLFIREYICFAYCLSVFVCSFFLSTRAAFSLTERAAAMEEKEVGLLFHAIFRYDMLCNAMLCL